MHMSLKKQKKAEGSFQSEKIGNIQIQGKLPYSQMWSIRDNGKISKAARKYKMLYIIGEQ